MRARRLLAGATASLLIGAGTIVATSLPASAATDIKICNSSDSTDLHRIMAWFTNSGAYYYVTHGNCSPWLSNNSGQVRVDTCPDNNVFSYYQIKSDSGYGPKHYGCNSNSNPPDYNGNVYYKQMN